MQWGGPWHTRTCLFTTPEVTCSLEEATPSKTHISLVLQPNWPRVDILTGARFIENARKDQKSPYISPFEGENENYNKEGGESTGKA